MSRLFCIAAILAAFCTAAAAPANTDADAAAALALAAAKPPQAPTVPEQAPQARCFCAWTGVCTCPPGQCACPECLRLTSVPLPKHVYDAAAAMAVASRMPLVVGLRCAPPHDSSWMCCEVDSLQGFTGEGIVVSRPHGDWLAHVVTLPANATKEQIRAALAPPVMQSGAGASAGPSFAGPVPMFAAPAPMYQQFAAPVYQQQHFAAPMYAAPKFSGGGFRSGPACVGGG